MMKGRGYQSVTNKFWSYVKSKRRDISGVTKRLLIAKVRQRYRMLSMTLFFTNANLASIPILQEKSFPPLPDMDINVRVSPSYWKNSIHKKANRPDQVSTRVLTIPHHTFNKSLLTSDLPIDWLTANMSLTSVSCKLLEHIIFHHIMDTWINTTSCPISNTGLGLSTLVRPNSSQQ